MFTAWHTMMTALSATRVWRTRRSSRWLATVFMPPVFVWISVETFINGEGLLTAVLPLVFVFAVIYLGAYRPQLRVEGDCITVINPLRRHRLDLSSVTHIATGYSGVEIMAAGKVTHAWAVQEANFSHFLGRETRASRVVAELTAIVEGKEHRSES